MSSLFGWIPFNWTIQSLWPNGNIEYLGDSDGVWAQVKAKLAAPLLRSPSAAIDRCRRRRRRRRRHYWPTFGPRRGRGEARRGEKGRQIRQQRVLRGGNWEQQLMMLLLPIWAKTSRALLAAAGKRDSSDFSLYRGHTEKSKACELFSVNDYYFDHLFLGIEQQSQQKFSLSLEIDLRGTLWHWLMRGWIMDIVLAT